MTRLMNEILDPAGTDDGSDANSAARLLRRVRSNPIEFRHTQEGIDPALVRGTEQISRVRLFLSGFLHGVASVFKRRTH